MTSDTEKTKREMYRVLKEVKAFCDVSMDPLVGDFEDKLESHLEALRQELGTSHIATGDTAILLSEMTADRDALRNKLQAFEFANKSAGELLIHAQGTIKKQRQYIRTLYTSRAKRKPMAVSK